MRKLLIITGFIMVSFYARAARCAEADSLTNGIHFQQGLSWPQVLAKAKSEKKYIFIDCYATWCVPCKKMDREVYPLKSVGDFFNAKFISVKLQIDTAKNDNEVIKSSYADACYIEKKYKVLAYPTFLFFNPDGQILNIRIGAMQSDDFIKIAQGILDPEKDYYKLLSDYKKGRRDPLEMSYLARTALMLLRDTAQSNSIAKNYLLNLKKNDWYKKENIEFMREFTKSSKDIGFTFFYRHTDTINRVMDDDTYSQGFVAYIINKEMVSPQVKLNKGANSIPDWTAIENQIRKKYNASYAERVVLAAKVNWNAKCKNWPVWSKYFVLYNNQYGTKSDSGQLTALILNNNAWELFTYSNSKDALNKALNWSGRAVMMDPDPGWMDTYANILYKLGKKELAIKWETVAVKQAPKSADIGENFEKMKNDLPTWPKN
jgi:thioredoxin-related protein